MLTPQQQDLFLAGLSIAGPLALALVAFALVILMIWCPDRSGDLDQPEGGA